ncbi:phosphoribosylanthranilate isomerase [Halobacteriaceae archaeon GCM10025711]
MPRVKICGLTRPADVDAAVAAGADALGFVVDVPVDTPREVSPARAADLVDQVPPFATTVLVTMTDDPDHAIELVRRVGPDVLQLHGSMSDGEFAYLAAKLSVDLVKTVAAGDADVVHRYDDLADALLVDSADDAGAGGTGRTHDWEETWALARSVTSPVILAGGLTPDNVAEAVQAVHPFGVDVASGVEATGGEKDHSAVEAFVAAAKETQRPVRP